MEEPNKQLEKEEKTCKLNDTAVPISCGTYIQESIIIIDATSKGSTKQIDGWHLTLQHVKIWC